MRRFICIILAALFVLASCSKGNSPEEPEISASNHESSESASEPEISPADKPSESEGADFYEELYNRNARIAASFDFDEFSVWFAITPIQENHNQNRWDFANGGNRGIPFTVAVVKNSMGRYALVEEITANLDLRLKEWHFDEMPEELPVMKKHHLQSRDGYMFTNFVDTETFSGSNSLRRQALVVCTDETLTLLYQSPMDDTGAAGEHLGGILFGMSADNNLLRQIILGKEGIITDSSIVTKGDYKSQFYTLNEFSFTPEKNTITFGRITASTDGITETPYEVEFDVLANGEIFRADNMLNLSARTLTEVSQGNSITTGAQYPVIGGKICHFPFLAPHIEQDSQMRYSSFDLQSQTHLAEQLLYDFGTETITSYSHTEKGFRVDTVAAAYYFDDNFEMIRRLPWPNYTSSGVFNENFTLLAFRGEVDGTHGMYLLNLETNKPPILLIADIDLDFKNNISGEAPFPIRFIGGDRLYTGVGAWEHSFFRMVDTSGNILEEFPFAASGMISGGYNYSNSAIAIFIPMQSEIEPHYYDFERGTLSRTDWWKKDELEIWNYYVPDSGNPHIWYVNSAHFDQLEFPRQIEKSSILRLDFVNKTVEPLIAAPNVKMTLLSASKNGELVFAYANDEDYGFAVFRQGSSSKPQ